MGCVGDTLKNLVFHLYADVDVAGDASKAGMYLAIRGERTKFPINGQSKRQDCFSRSKPEADIVAADIALCSGGLLSLAVLRPGRPVDLPCGQRGDDACVWLVAQPHQPEP